MNKYLEQLKYRSEDFSGILRGYIGNMRVVSLLIVMLVAAGIFAFMTLPRTSAPQINITIGVVTTVLPGATPEDVESLITIPLEREIDGVDDLDIMTSTSREGVSSIVVQFEDGTDRATASADLQTAVDAVRDLPGDATDPAVKMIDFEDDPVVRYALTADGVDSASLNQFATELKDELEALALVDRVTLAGAATREVQVMVAPEQLTTLGVSPQVFAAAITAATKSYPAGAIYSDASSFSLTIDREAMTLADLRQSIVRIGGTAYRLGDIAVVSERRAPGAVPALLGVPQDGALTAGSAVTLSVYRTLGSEMNIATEAIDAAAQELLARPGSERFSLVTILNVNNEMQREFDDLFSNLTTTIILVFITLFIFVGIRQAFVAALSIPMVFMVTFMVMLMTDVSLNFLSLFALLLSLGLLVDVTIVVISAMTSYHRSGRFTPFQTGLLVFRDFGLTLLITTLTTVWAFVPLLLASGIIGEYIKPIPVIVSTMLLASVFIGLFVILPLMVWLLDFFVARRVRVFFAVLGALAAFGVLRGVLSAVGVTVPGALCLVIFPLWIGVLASLFYVLAAYGRAIERWIHKRFGRAETLSIGVIQHGIVDLRRVERAYRRVLYSIVSSRMMRRKVVAMVVVLFIFSFALVPLGFVKNVFFPAGDGSSVYVALEYPLGTRAEVALDHAQALLPVLSRVPEVQFAQLEIGSGLDDRSMPSGGKGDHAALYTLKLTDMNARDITATEIVAMIRGYEEITAYPYGDVSIGSDQGGPPAGADVTLKIFGDDSVELDRTANDVMRHLEQQSGVFNVAKSIIPGTAKVVFVPDDAALSDAGVTIGAVAQALRTFSTGYTIDEDVAFVDLSDERDIILRTSENVQSVQHLQQVTIETSAGDVVPVHALGRFELAPNPTLITREDGERTISVTASVDEGVNAQEVNEALLAYVEEGLDLPAGYHTATGGANEENNKSVQSIVQAMGLAFVLIFLTLITLLNSYRKSFIVLLVIPLAISGVFIVFALLGLPLSFPSLIGILALFGIVINNSIIIIDQINKNLAQGIEFDDAVVDGATSRLEPIFMSSLTTIIGLLPITLSDPVWMGLGGAIMAGLSFSGIIMLFFIPVVYYMMMRDERA